jgi:hypothetical protein
MAYYRDGFTFFVNVFIYLEAVNTFLSENSVSREEICHRATNQKQTSRRRKYFLKSTTGLVRMTELSKY